MILNGSIGLTKMKRFFLTTLFLGALFGANPSECRGYLLPGEQIIGLMCANFKAFKTLVVVESFRTVYEEENGTEFKGRMRKIWLKAPAFFRSETIGESEGPATGGKGMAISGSAGLICHLLLMARDKQSQMDLLTNMGIDVTAVSLQRDRESIAYRIGGPGGGDPYLIVEKERFLPLEMRFCARGRNRPVLLTIRFDEYRRLEKGWYPYRISYSGDGQPLGSCTVNDLDTNPPIKDALSSIPLEDILPSAACKERDTPPQEERIDNIIKSFQDKYL